MLKAGSDEPKEETPKAVIAGGTLQETRLSEGAVSSTSLYPNPSNGNAVTMRFTLDEPRSVSMSLMNLNGEVVADLASDVVSSPGENEIGFSTNEVSPGMYLVSLTTQQGEHVVQRLIVQ